MAAILENTTSYETINFTDKDGAPAVPTAVSYKIHDVDTGTEIKGSTAVSPGDGITVTISAAENTLLDQTKNYEQRLITVTATFAGGTEQLVYERRYSIKRAIYD